MIEDKQRFTKKGKLPNSNINFWKDKIGKNIQRDKKNKKTLMELGWSVFTVWECYLEGGLTRLVKNIKDNTN